MSLNVTEIKESVRALLNDLIEEARTKDYSELIEYAKKFESGEQLLRKGGFPTELLDRAAFGFSEDDVTTLHPKDLNVIWKDDLENVEYQIELFDGSPRDWAKTVDLSEPIEVSFDGKNFNIEDGHHRYTAAKILNKKLNVDLWIKAKPLKYILGTDNYDYDKFHRDIHDMI